MRGRAAIPELVKGKAGSAKYGSNDPCTNMGHRHLHRLQSQQVYGPKHDHGCIPGHPDQYGPSSSMTLGHWCGLMWLTRCWASAEPMVITEAMDITPSPGHCRTMDPDMSLDSGLFFKVNYLNFFFSDGDLHQPRWSIPAKYISACFWLCLELIGLERTLRGFVHIKAIITIDLSVTACTPTSQVQQLI